MNPGPDDPVHLLHVEEDGDELAYWLECPFPQTCLREVDDQLGSSCVELSGVHAERRYCTWGPGFAGNTVFPVIRHEAQWTGRWGGGERMAVIELGVRTNQFGICGYEYTASNVGLEDALDVEFPYREGTWPVFYWSEGTGEDFMDGLTLVRPEEC